MTLNTIAEDNRQPFLSKEIERVSKGLRSAVILTLGLKETDSVFTGNEEKIFLLALFQSMPDSTHPTSKKFSNHRGLICHRMIDIWSGEVSKRCKAQTDRSQSIKERARGLTIHFRALIIRLRDQIFLKKTLARRNKIIHYAAHLRYGSFVVPNLTDLFFTNEYKKDKKMRNYFLDNLKISGIETTLAKYLANLFPISHLELYQAFKNHEVSNIKKIDVVATSVYGIMEDPLLSFLVRNNNSRLVYVQHGAGYGISKLHVGHCWLPGQIEQVISQTNVALCADGSGIKEPTKSELKERLWRTDPSDGLRPFKSVRKGFL